MTGASGFVGKHLSRKLASLGAHVIRLGYSESSDSDVFASPRDHQRILSIFKDSRPELVIHLGGYVTGNPDPALTVPMFEANLSYAVGVCEAARQTGVRKTILFGTSEEHCIKQGRTVSHSPYGISKQALFLYFKYFSEQCGLPVTYGRPSQIYGPGQAPEKLIPQLIRGCLDGEVPELQNPHKSCNFIYIDDLVDAVLGALVSDEAAGHCLDWHGGESRTVLDVTERICEQVGLREPCENPGLESAGADLGQVFGPLEATRKLTGWSPVTTFDQGLRNTIEDIRNARN